MKNSSQLILMIVIVISAGWITNQPPIEWTTLKTDSVVFKSIFWEEKIRPITLTDEDVNKSMEIIRANFDSIKFEVKLKQSLSITDYRFQLVGGINQSNEKVTFVNCIGKKLPKSFQSGWKTKLIELKCVNDDLVHVKLNLKKENYTQAYKAECK